MDLERKLKEYKDSIKIIPNEQRITETVRKSIEVYCFAEQESVQSGT